MTACSAREKVGQKHNILQGSNLQFITTWTTAQVIISSSLWKIITLNWRVCCSSGNQRETLPALERWPIPSRWHSFPHFGDVWLLSNMLKAIYSIFRTGGIFETWDPASVSCNLNIMLPPCVRVIVGSELQADGQRLNLNSQELLPFDRFFSPTWATQSCRAPNSSRF